MENNLFDKHVKEQMDGLRPDVGLHIWENIAKKMEEKKPVAFWSLKRALLMLLLLLVTIGGGTFLYNKIENNKTSQASAQQTTTGKKTTTSQNEPSINNNETATKTNENNTETTGLNTIDNTDKNNTANNKITTEAKSNEQDDLQNTNSSNKVLPSQNASDVKNMNTSTALSSITNNTKRQNDIATKETNDINQQKLIASKKRNVFKTNSNSFLEKNNGAISKIKTKKRNTKATGSSTVLNMENDNTAINNEQIQAPKYLQLFTNALEFKKTNKQFDSSIFKRVFPIIPCPEIEKNAAGNKKYLEFYAGPDYIFRSFSDTGKIYAEQRKASTGIHFAFSAGLRYTRVFGNGISIRTGINYSQMNERFVSFNGYILERIVQVNAAGDTTANFTQSSIQYKKSTNIYRSIDIPFQLGYEMGNGRLHTNIGLGVNINIASRQVGSVLDNTGKPIDISTGAASSIYQFKTNAGVSFLGSVSFYYKLDDHWHLMLEPYIRYSLSPYTKPDITFKQKFNAAGVRFGVRWDF
jgi:uncharacterized protein YxeA